MAKTKDDYQELGLRDAQADTQKNRPKSPGWQQAAYDRGSRLNAVKVVVPTQRKGVRYRQLSTEPLRLGVLLPEAGVLSAPITEHLKILNHAYRHAVDARYSERLLGSMGRILYRWLPRF